MRLAKLFRREPSPSIMVNREETRKIARDWESNSYYRDAENPEWLKIFWCDDSIFRRLFSELSLETVVELACGHGRHAQQIVDRCGRMILLDVNRQNVETCRRRFAALRHVECFTNDGLSFTGVADGSVSAIFCYDAMVHFEADAVIGYLNDAKRVLRDGGRALFHHSNYDKNPGGSYRENPHWRNFLSQNMFKHFASRAGLTVLDSSTMAWGTESNLDCVTLLERRSSKTQPRSSAGVDRNARDSG